MEFQISSFEIAPQTDLLLERRRYEGLAANRRSVASYGAEASSDGHRRIGWLSSHTGIGDGAPVIAWRYARRSRPWFLDDSVAGAVPKSPPLRLG